MTKSSSSHLVNGQCMEAVPLWWLRRAWSEGKHTENINIGRSKWFETVFSSDSIGSRNGFPRKAVVLRRSLLARQSCYGAVTCGLWGASPTSHGWSHPCAHPAGLLHPLKNFIMYPSAPVHQNFTIKLNFFLWTADLPL